MTGEEKARLVIGMLVVPLSYEWVFGKPDVQPVAWVFPHEDIAPIVKSSKTGSARLISRKQVRESFSVFVETAEPGR